MQRLKGVFKYKGYDFEFAEWVSRTNNINIHYGWSNEYRVNVAYKVGKKKKLKTLTIRVYNSTCECCGTTTTYEGFP